MKRLHSFFRRQKLDTDMSEEMRLHLEQRIEENVAAGMSRDDARYAALRKFGGIEQAKELARDQRGFLWVDQLIHDVRYAARHLGKNRGVTAIIVLSLALGIGANTAVFSFVDEIFLKPLPVERPGELVQFLWHAGRDGLLPSSGIGGGRVWRDPQTEKPSAGTGFSPWMVERFNAGNETLSELFAFGHMGSAYVFVNGEAESISWLFVTGEYHHGLGVRAAAGRLLVADDDRTDAPPVVVISHDYWTRRFNRDATAVGQTIVVNNRPVTIVGVTPADFFGVQLGATTPLTLPLGTLASFMPKVMEDAAKRPGEYGWLQVMGRLKPETTRERAAANFSRIFDLAVRDTLARRIPGRENAYVPGGLPRLTVESGAQGVTSFRDSVGQFVAVLGGLVALILLITCLNVANLLLASGAAREKELALRLALGASRGRLVRQLLTESTLLALLGAAAGVWLAARGRDLLLQMGAFRGVELPVPPLDQRVLAFTVTLAALTSVVFGLVPALRSIGADPQAGLKSGWTSGGRGSVLGLGRMLIAAQVALSLVLLIGAAMFGQTVRNLRSVEVGFNRENLVMFGIKQKPPGYKMERLRAILEEASETIGRAPGVRTATYSNHAVLTGAFQSRPVFVEGAPATAPNGNYAEFNLVAPNFFSAFEMPLLLGRGFTRADDDRAAKVAVLNQSAARLFFGDENPVGRRIGWETASAGEVEVVGVVRDGRTVDLKRTIEPVVFIPFLQEGNGWVNFTVRTAGPAGAAIPDVIRALRTVDPTLIPVNVRTQEIQIEHFLARERLFAQLTSWLGALALALVSIGLYGLMSYAVHRRTKEIGIRMALGALPRNVLAMILRQSLVAVGIGAMMGVVLAWTAIRAVWAMLYGVSPVDPLAYGGGIFVLVAVATVACLFPARRAAKVDPMVALRAE